MRDNPTTVAFVALTIGVVATVSVFAYRSESTRKIITNSPCLKNPESRECAEVRLEVAMAEPIRNPCASFQRVTSQRGRNCERFYVSPNGGRGGDRGGVVLEVDEGGSEGAEQVSSGDGGDEGKPPADAKPDPDPSGSKSPQGKGGGKEAVPDPSGERAGGDIVEADQSDSGEPEPESESSGEPKPGLVDNPGGVLGAAVCSVNRLGVPVCTE